MRDVNDLIQEIELENEKESQIKQQLEEMEKEIEELEKLKKTKRAQLDAKDRAVKEKCEMATIHKGVICQILSDKPST